MSYSRLSLAAFFCCASLATAQIRLQDQPPLPTAVARPEGLRDAASFQASQDVTRYTLGELEQIAINNNPALSEAAARIEAALGRSWQAGLPPNPTIGYLGTEIGNEGGPGQHGGYVARRWITAGKLQLDRAVACRDVQRLQQEYQVARQRVITDVRKAFFMLVLLQQRIDLLTQFATINQTALDIANQLFAVQEVARSDVLLSENELEQTRLDLASLQATRLNRWRELTRIVGVNLAHGMLDPHGVDEVPMLQWSEAVDTISRSPELAALEAELRRSQFALRRALVEPHPNINTQFSVQYEENSQDTFASVQIGVPLPVRNRNQGGIREAQANVRAVESKLIRTRMRIEKEMAARFGRYQAAKLQVERYSSVIVPRAQEAVQIALEAYGAGEQDLAAVLNAERALLRAILRQLDAQQELRSALVEMEGFLLEGSLDDRGAAAMP